LGWDVSMCKYSFGNGRCASMDIHFNFCIGEKNCYVSDILKNRIVESEPEPDDWQFISSKLWNTGNIKNEDK
jgi:hypothetical protein